MFLFRRRREASVKLLEPVKKQNKEESEQPENTVEVDLTGKPITETLPVVKKETVKKVSGKAHPVKTEKKETKTKKEEAKKEEPKKEEPKRSRFSLKLGKPSAGDAKKAKEKVEKAEKAAKPAVKKKEPKKVEAKAEEEIPIQVITAEDLAETDDVGNPLIDLEAEGNVSDEVADSLLVPVNNGRIPVEDEQLDELNLDLEPVEDAESEEESESDESDDDGSEENGYEDVQSQDEEENTENNEEMTESSVEAPEIKAEDIPAAPEIKTEAEQSSENPEEEKKEEDGNLFSALFGGTEVVEETALDKLVKSLPEITIEEVMNEAEDVNNIIHDWYQQKINRV